MKETSTQSCLVIVDVINGFIKEGPMADQSIAHIIKPIEEIIKDFKSKGYPIIALCDAHEKDSREFSAFLPHCIAGSHESELVDELKVYEDVIVRLNKNSINGFLAPEFIAWFKDQPIYKNYVVVGCVTDICVLNFASTLLAYLHEHNYESNVIVTTDTSDTFHIENHNKAIFNEMAYTLMKQLGVLVYDHVTLEQC